MHCIITLEKRTPLCPTCSRDSGTESNGVSSLDLIINNVTDLIEYKHKGKKKKKEVEVTVEFKHVIMDMCQ